MEYREHAPPPALEGLVKVRWTLAGGGAPDAWVEQQAVPDGCIELIRRLAGRSRWDEAQPDTFVVGLIEKPEAFSMSGDARFEGLRIWPWAWHLISDISLRTISGRWMVHDGPFEVTPNAHLAAIGKAIVAAETVAEMSEGTGMNPRALQRWFAAYVGMPPRRYLRLLRFQKAFEQIPGETNLAAHAAEQGFADQAHMAREFRALAGVPAKQARRNARGPFLT